MRFLELFGLTTKRAAIEMSSEAKSQGWKDGVKFANTYKPGMEIACFVRTCRKYRLRVVSNVADETEMQQNVSRLLSEQMNVMNAKETAAAICANVKIVKAGDEDLFF